MGVIKAFFNVFFGRGIVAGQNDTGDIGPWGVLVLATLWKECPSILPGQDLGDPVALGKDGLLAWPDRLRNLWLLFPR